MTQGTSGRSTVNSPTLELCHVPERACARMRASAICSKIIFLWYMNEHLRHGHVSRSRSLRSSGLNRARAVMQGSAC